MISSFNQYTNLGQEHQNFLALNKWSLLAEVPQSEWVYIMLKCSPLAISRPARIVTCKGHQQKSSGTHFCLHYFSTMLIKKLTLTWYLLSKVILMLGQQLFSSMQASLYRAMTSDWASRISMALVSKIPWILWIVSSLKSSWGYRAARSKKKYF